MNADHIRQRLSDAVHRGDRKATEEDVAEVTAVVLAVVAEVAAEMGLVLAELADRVEALEQKVG